MENGHTCGVLWARADPGGDQVEEKNVELGVREHGDAERWRERERSFGRRAVRGVYGRDEDAVQPPWGIYTARTNVCSGEETPNTRAMDSKWAGPCICIPQYCGVRRNEEKEGVGEANEEKAVEEVDRGKKYHPILTSALFFPPSQLRTEYGPAHLHAAFQRLMQSAKR